MGGDNFSFFIFFSFFWQAELEISRDLGPKIKSVSVSWGRGAAERGGSMIMQPKDVGNQYLLTNEIHGMEVTTGFTLEGLFILIFI